MSVDTDRLRGLEAILFLAAEPLAADALAAALEIAEEEVAALVTELEQRLTERESGLVVRHVAGGWRLYTAAAAREHVERFVLAGRSGRLSQAALETLAVIAYKQPISRTEVGEVRGVNADGAVRSLVTRGLIEEVGRDDGPGQAVLYGTTTEFLEKVGLQSIEDLPPLTEFLPEEPAPDEPTPDQLREARRRLQAGRELPSTGRAAWDPDADEGDAPDDDVRARREAVVQRRRDQETEMEELTGALERVARSAMAQLRDAVAASDDDGDGDDPEDADAPADDGAHDDGKTETP